MDLRVYFQKIRDKRQSLKEKDYVVVSLETGDGGVAGVCTEVPADVAAKMVVDGTAVLAEADTAAAFRQGQAAAKEQADQELAAARVPLSLVPTAVLNRLRVARDKE